MNPLNKFHVNLFSFRRLISFHISEHTFLDFAGRRFTKTLSKTI